MFVMTTLLSRLGRTLEDRDSERGASAVEYGLLVAGIAAVIVAGVFLFGDFINDVVFGESCGTITAYVTGDCG